MPTMPLSRLALLFVTVVEDVAFFRSILLKYVLSCAVLVRLLFHRCQICLPGAEHSPQPCGVYGSTLSWCIIGDGALVKVTKERNGQFGGISALGSLV